jgi:hypothetical protein
MSRGHELAPDNWPLPKFDAGNAKHLHAVGVIAVTFVQFERSIEGLFLHHPANNSVPLDLIQRYFFALSEDQRVHTTRKFYADSEPDDAVKLAVNNVLDFFNWAHDSRNKILHAERYPPGLGADPNMFYLIKRASKRDHSSKYMKLDLSTLRLTAERMRSGIVRSAEINIHIRYRNTDLSKIDQSIWAYAESNDFPALMIPVPLVLTDRPER